MPFVSSVFTTIAFIAHTAIVARSQSSSWTPNGSMPFERGEIAVAAVNDKIYVISGSSRGVEANAFNQEFDPATGMWRERALMPSVASHAGAASAQRQDLHRRRVRGQRSRRRREPRVRVRPGGRSLARPGATQRSARLSRRCRAQRKDSRHRRTRPGAQHRRHTRNLRPRDQQLDDGSAAAAGARSSRRRRCRRADPRLRRANECDRGQYRPPRRVRPRHQQLERGGAAPHTAQRGRRIFLWLAGSFMREANARIRREASRSPRSRRTTREPTGGRPCRRCSRDGTLPALQSSDNRHISLGATWAAVATGRQKRC